MPNPLKKNVLTPRNCIFSTAGLFAKSSVDLKTADGAFYSNGAQLGVQLLGVVTALTWSLLCTYALTWLIRLTVSFVFPIVCLSEAKKLGKREGGVV